MTKTLINPATDKTLAQVMKDVPQSLLLTGDVGVGLGTIAHYIAHQLSDIVMTVLPEKDDKVDMEKGTITVDSIRRLYTQTRSIHTSKQVIVIDYAERMGAQAQNAFLKLLEEPSDGVHFILATHTPSKLLPTVTSRMQSLDIRPITLKQTETLLDTLDVASVQKRTQLLFMATGRPAEITRLVSDDAYFESRVDIVRDARDLLQATTYKKLQIAQKYKDSRESALLLLTDASAILRRSISAKPDGGLINQIDALLYAYQQIAANGNIRLCLARLVV